MPDVNWDKYHRHSSDSVRILNFLINQGFEQLVTLPTHINGNTLDLIFSNFSTCHFSEVDTGITDFADHFRSIFSAILTIKKHICPIATTKSTSQQNFILVFNWNSLRRFFLFFLPIPLKTILTTGLKTLLSFYHYITERSAKNVKIHLSIVLPTPCTSQMSSTLPNDAVRNIPRP